MASRVCTIRDDRFLEHKTGLVSLEHPNRLKAIHQMLDTNFSGTLTNIKPEPAAMDVLELVHTPIYIEKILKTAEYEFTHLSPDTPASPKTYMAAFLAVGGCLQALDALMSGRCEAAFALIRPPGHHALPDRASGFCIFNNLGVTALQALCVYGLDRILIVDWDIHHGNALQRLFYNQKEIFYFSSHYVFTFPQTGAWEDAGQGPGLGYTVNVPLFKNLGDEDILHCYRDILGPIIRNYRPQIILVAAGFDGHRDDPLGRTDFTEQGYGWLTQLIMDLAAEVGDPPILLALEGGYDLKALAGSVREVLRALIAEEPRAELPHPFTPQGEELVTKAARIHAEYGVWADRSIRQETSKNRRML
ncbi:MAG: histone deacetylase [Deltaproteobacteria bacterium]|nr:histone deacetylase [Deltaproteobacteria bacterium]MBW2085922.1 histone deacetylase [Deltaproteobacteria bacterium]